MAWSTHPCSLWPPAAECGFSSSCYSSSSFSPLKTSLHCFDALPSLVLDPLLPDAWHGTHKHCEPQLSVVLQSPGAPARPSIATAPPPHEAYPARESCYCPHPCIAEASLSHWVLRHLDILLRPHEIPGIGQIMAGYAFMFCFFYVTKFTVFAI